MSRVENLAEGVDLWLGDCREILPTLGKVDAVLTDPPYSDLVHSTRGRRGEAIRNDGGPKLVRIDFDSVASIQDDIARLVCEACSGWFITFSDIFALPDWRRSVLSAGGKSKSVALWIKPDCAPQFNGQKPATAFECIGIFWCGTGYSKWNGGGSRGLYTHNTNGPDRHGAHPTEKPVSLMRELVSLFTNPGDIVCDPFAGSGTTGVAAVKFGRRFVGIEIEEKYFDIACRRISEALKQPDLFVEAPAAPVQLNLDDYKPRDDFAKSIDACYEAVRDRVAKGGPTWTPK